MADTGAQSSGLCPRMNIMICMVILYIPAVVIKRFTRLSNYSYKVKFAIVLLFLAFVGFVIGRAIIGIIKLPEEKVSKLIKMPAEVEEHLQMLHLKEQEMDFHTEEEEVDVDKGSLMNEFGYP